MSDSVDPGPQVQAGLASPPAAPVSLVPALSPAKAVQIGAEPALPDPTPKRGGARRLLLVLAALAAAGAAGYYGLD